MIRYKNLAGYFVKRISTFSYEDAVKIAESIFKNNNMNRAS